jgi:hypothetical protein
MAAATASVVKRRVLTPDTAIRYAFVRAATFYPLLFGLKSAAFPMAAQLVV